MLSAGWLWHPWDCLMVYDLAKALASPQVLDTFGDVFDMRGLIQAEISGACFIGDDVAVSTSAEMTTHLLARPQSVGDYGPGSMGQCR